MLDLERCSLIRPLAADAPTDLGPSQKLGCWATGQARPVTVAEQRVRCFTAAHTRCPALLEALAAAPTGAWTDLGTSLQVAAEACHLALARLEVSAERLEPALDQLFGSRR